MKNTKNDIKYNIQHAKVVGLVARNGENLKKNYELLLKLLDSYGVKLLCEASIAKILDKGGYSLDELATNCDFIISLGGDGTLISLCRNLAKFNPAVLGIHAGRLGFLTQSTMDGAPGLFKNIFAGNFVLEKPHFLDVLIEFKNGDKECKIAFNDAVLIRSNPASIVGIKAYLNGRQFNSYLGDGIIASTPIGSTAYNMSAGGSIIYPLSSVFALTPICSHSLTQRPLILPEDMRVSLEVSYGECELVLDGQESFSTDNIKQISVCLSKYKACLIRHEKRDYFQILKEKLNWGDNDR